MGKPMSKKKYEGCKGCVANPCVLFNTRNNFPEICPCKTCLVKVTCRDACDDRSKYCLYYNPVNGAPLYLLRSEVDG